MGNKDEAVTGRNILRMPVDRKEALAKQRAEEQHFAALRSNAQDGSDECSAQCCTTRMGYGTTRLKGTERAEYMRTFANARAGVPVTVLPQSRSAEKT